jgi:hypothetical protein
VHLPVGVFALFAAAFLCLLLAAAVAIVPASALPSRVAAAVDGRREALLFVALCVLGFGLVVMLFIALASS